MIRRLIDAGRRAYAAVNTATTADPYILVGLVSVASVILGRYTQFVQARTAWLDMQIEARRGELEDLGHQLAEQQVALGLAKVRQSEPDAGAE